ncbi:MAG: methylmalonyl Co-A mutase-associated GTPase MeaB [Deltaproteobacteria bacterium]|nr:methylmalonyl Co-A mutase-associated GTPase MeaB [Deltaproteobacteria bacterium]
MPGDIQPYIDGVLNGNRRMLSKTITLIESTHADHQKKARLIMDQLLPHTGKAIRMGITGVPGAGKSTFIDALGMMLLEMGHKVAVLAVDPSSVVTGGSVLADKTRMKKLSIEENAFIRPSPSGGKLGGVASKTRESMLVCEAAGFDVIIVETVGAGQSEVAVASMVDFFLILMIAGAGDELQGIKKGVLELADVVAINKADGDNINRAKLAQQQYEMALHISAPSFSGWRPPVVTCSARESKGIKEIWNIVTDHRTILAATGELDMKRRQQSLDWMWYLIKESLTESFNSDPQVKNSLTKIKREVMDGLTSPISAAEKLLTYHNIN